MPEYKLYFFNAMGRAEVIRVIFAQAGIPYEDIRLSREEFIAKKASFPFGVLPVLEVDGKPLSQSHAIASYLAKKYGLCGTDDWEAAKIQEYLGVGSDLANAAIPIFRMPDGPEKTAKMNEFEKMTLVPIMNGLSKALADNGNEHFVGKQLTVADLHNFCFIGLFGHMFPSSLENHENLKNFRETIQNLPKIKRWIEERPKTDY